ncbi:hypothetical protein JTB14_036145 [Gonioctena quinquepunctata]|nr:hypothetical protein JTB14_036145 [Gonioctena quinquepunctata]
MQRYAWRKRMIEEMETGIKDSDAKEMGDTKMAVKILCRPVGSRAMTGDIPGILGAHCQKMAKREPSPSNLDRMEKAHRENKEMRNI